MSALDDAVKHIQYSADNESDREWGEDAAAELVSLRARLEALEAAEQFHPRAMKLIRKKKNFLVVAEDEPYFETVYHEIKLHELLRGTWTEDDERRYLAALDGTR